jgi:hypothetical protein
VPSLTWEVLTKASEFGSPRQVDAKEKRMADLEKKNVELRMEITKQGTSAIGLPIGEKEVMDPPVESLVGRLNLLECQDGDLIRIGTYTFTNMVDCEAFLLTKVLSKVLLAYCYNMVSLVHRVPKSGSALSVEGILQQDDTAHKGGFSQVGLAYIYSSMQQAVPGPLEGASAHPLPGVKLFEDWDGKDKLTGLWSEITRSMDTTVQALMVMLSREFRGHPEALAVLPMTILQGQIHWKAYANFMTNSRNVFKQCEDEKEAWLYPSEVGRGVFEEVLKV